MERRKARRITQKPNKVWLDTDRKPTNSTDTQEKNQTNTNFNPFEVKLPVSRDEPRFPDQFAANGPESSYGGREGQLVRTSRRSYAEGLVERAAWLPAEERDLIEAVFRDGLSVAAYVRQCRDRGTAMVNGTGASAARSARRKLRRVERRLASDRFGFVTTQRNTWPTTRRRVAISCVVQGHSLRESASILGISLHTVRRHMEAVEALFTEYLLAQKQGRSSSRMACADREYTRAAERTDERAHGWSE